MVSVLQHLLLSMWCDFFLSLSCLQACRLQSERENDRTEVQAWQTQLLQQVAAVKGQQQQQQQHAATAAASIAAESAAVRRGAEGLAEEVSMRQRALLANMAALVTDIEGYRCASMIVHDEALHMTGAVSANQWYLQILQHLSVVLALPRDCCLCIESEI
jgi:hypothetical protein